jgi:hypothetical protein
MDERSFDDLTRNVANRMSRRGVLRGLIGGAAALAGLKATNTIAADKTTICHFPPENPANVQIISVGNPSLPDHFAHGDMVYGECCFASECAPVIGECSVLVGCLADVGSPSSCVYSDDPAACGGGNVCDGQLTCSNGACVPGEPLDCSGIGDQCNAGRCDPDIGCYLEPLGSETSCNNGTGTCSGGSCIQTCQATFSCDCSDANNDGLGCNDGEGTCAGGVCVPNCEPNCTCSYTQNEGQLCNGGEGVCTDGVCVQTCQATSSCDCSDTDNEGLGCNGGEGVCTGGVCVQTCQATETCDCSDADNEGLGCNGGEGICQGGVCVPSCEQNCTCTFAENDGLECEDGVGVCVDGECVTCGSISGQVTSSATGNGISGANVTVAGQNTTTDPNGDYSFSCVPAGEQLVEASATGFGPGSNTVAVIAGDDVTANITLVPVSAVDQITIVLNWNGQPDDLDSHLTGPDVEHGGRFHVLWSNQNPVSYASLDVDDIDGNGPETVTVIETSGGAFVPGDYHYWVYNYSNGTNGLPGDFSISGATVTIAQDAVPIAQYDVGSASGSQAQFIWYVLNFTLAEDGTITLNPVQTMMNGSNGTVL